MKRNRLLQILKWAFILVIIISLVLFIRHSEIEKIGQYLYKVGFNFLIIIAVTFVAQIMGTIGWLYAFPKHILNISFYRLFSIRMIGEYIGIINPSSIVGGDGLKSYLLYKEGIKTAQSLSSLLIFRAIMISTQVGMFVGAAIIYSIFVTPSHQLGRIILLSLCILAVLSWAIHALLKKGGTSIFQKLFGQKRLKTVEEILTNIKTYYATNPSRFYLSSFFSSMNWIIGSLEIFLIFYFLDLNITFIASLLVDQGILVLKSFGAFIPGQLGIEEYSNKVMFSIIGMTGLEVWIAASVLRRARQLVWIAISSILYLSIRIESEPGSSPDNLESP